MVGLFPHFFPCLLMPGGSSFEPGCQPPLQLREHRGWQFSPTCLCKGRLKHDVHVNPQTTYIGVLESRLKSWNQYHGRFMLIQGRLIEVCCEIQFSTFLGIECHC